MPWAPPRPCRWPRCSRLAHGGFCDEHRAAYEQQRDQQRPSARERGYGGDWRTIRARVLAEQPVCADCGVNAATEVHHTVPIRRGGTNARGNLVGLCGGCHRRRTARQQGV